MPNWVIKMTADHSLSEELRREDKRAERRREVRLAITEILAQAATVQEAAPSILGAICRGLGWDVGGFWLLSLQADSLHCLTVWQLPPARAPRFEAASRGRVFTPGVGLPGRVWSSRKPEWIADVVPDGNFPRAAVAAAEGLHGSFAFPLCSAASSSGSSSFSAVTSVSRTPTCWN